MTDNITGKVIIITGASEATGVDMRTGEEKPKESYEDDFTRRYGEDVRGQLQNISQDAFIDMGTQGLVEQE